MEIPAIKVSRGGKGSCLTGPDLAWTPHIISRPLSRRRARTTGMNTPDDGSSQDLTEVIARWQQRLLDLTKRNRLLYFRSGRSAVRLTSHTPDQISEELLSQASGLSFDYAERRQTRKPIFVDPLSDEVEVADLEPDVVKGALDTDCEVFDLQRRLKLLQHQDTEWEQEQGINVLFLALGRVKPIPS